MPEILSTDRAIWSRQPAITAGRDGSICLSSTGPTSWDALSERPDASGSQLPAFPPELPGRPSEPGPATTPAKGLGLEVSLRGEPRPDATNLYSETHRQPDRLLLPLVLEYTRRNQHRAARLPGIARQTLRQELRDLGLSVSRPAEADEDDPG